ncbi:MAG: transcription-repair coupling factor [Oligoflexia bacterium]
MLTSPLSKIFSAARELAEPIRISGLAGSSRAWFVLRVLQEFKKPLLVLCPDEESAQSMLSDCEALAPLIAPPIGGPEARLIYAPGWERPVFSPIAPSLRVRNQRSAALASLAEGASARPIVFTTPAGLALRTLSPGEFRALSLELVVGSSDCNRELAIQKLLAAGYLRVDSVEDPGTFAVRGEILDVFSPGAEQPLRVEFFDDLIEKIRPFDPSSQRTHGDQPLKERVILFPCRESILGPHNRQRVREALKQILDDKEVPRVSRDPILEGISDGAALGSYPERSDYWAAFTSSSPGSLAEHLSRDALWIQWDDLGCDQAWDQLWQDEQTGFSRVAETLAVAPKPADLYDLELLQKLRPRLRFVLQKIALTELEETPQAGAVERSGSLEVHSGAPSPTHRVGVSENSDLAALPATARLDELIERLSVWKKQGFSVQVECPTQGQADRLSHVLAGRGIVADQLVYRVSSLSAGFRWPSEGRIVLTENEVLGSGGARRKTRGGARGQTAATATQDWAGLQELSDLSPGDAIVHQEHGIGRYTGIARLSTSGAPADFLQIEYANHDKLYLPVYRLNQIQKHNAGGDSVTLDRLGSAQFQKTKARVRDSVRALAIDLVKLYAERSIREGHRYPGRDPAFEEFEARFPYEETPDQAAAIDAILHDLSEGKVMDRLVCGDVGYGKTEVAIRAAYRVATDARQVAVLVPTTLLAHQHEQSFRSRLQGLPVVIESLSRFKGRKEQKEILERVEQGKVDILIGTHRLLSRDVRFRDLGLLVVDEEHRFGVEHKEKIKSFKTNIPVITLTATPIPRTLHMALSGLREISLIRTPPVDRLPIRTFISKQDDAVVSRAIEFELGRGGQVFYLHNRVESIFEAAARVRELCPAARVSVAHGQMAESELETAVRDFYDKKTNVLVCTSIIESGIDLPSANTIIIHRADTFGLAQLYQIRGRVGRGQQRGYAYLLIPNELAISEDAKKRLDVIQRFVELGSGFNVASHDLDIRGGGDLLGAQQSGNIMAVGFDMYLSLLEEAVQEIKVGQVPTQTEVEPEIKAPFPAFLAEDFVPDIHQRLSLYRRLSSASSDEAVDELEAELIDRFGKLPDAAASLLWLIRVKVHLKRLRIDALTVGPERLVLTPGRTSALDPVRAIALVSGHPHLYSITPESRFVARGSVRSMKDLYFAIQTLLKNLAPVQSVANPSGQR